MVVEEGGGDIEGCFVVKEEGVGEGFGVEDGLGGAV